MTAGRPFELDSPPDILADSLLALLPPDLETLVRLGGELAGFVLVLRARPTSFQPTSETLELHRFTYGPGSALTFLAAAESDVLLELVLPLAYAETRRVVQRPRLFLLASTLRLPLAELPAPWTLAPPRWLLPPSPSGEPSP